MNNIKKKPILLIPLFFLVIMFFRKEDTNGDYNYEAEARSHEAHTVLNLIKDASFKERTENGVPTCFSKLNIKRRHNSYFYTVFFVKPNQKCDDILNATESAYIKISEDNIEEMFPTRERILKALDHLVFKKHEAFVVAAGYIANRKELDFWILDKDYQVIHIQKVFSFPGSKEIIQEPSL
jgi:hypothetical protein